MPVIPHLRTIAAAPAVLGLLFALAGCAAGGPEGRAGERTADPARLAERGRHADAAEAWLELAREQPADAVDARLAAARQWILAGNLAAARRLVDELARAGLEGDEVFELDLVRAELALAERDFTTAERILAVPRDGFPPQLQPRFEALSARLAESNPDSPQARIDALSTALDEPDFRPEMALALLVELPLRTLEELRAGHAGDPKLDPWLKLAVAARGALLDDAALERSLEQWRTGHGLEPAVAPDLAEWIRVWRASMPYPDSIAVLLPGEGPLERAGEVLRGGLIAAWLQMSPQRRPALDFFHLGTDEQAGVGAWFDARADGAEFIIGPLDRTQVGPLAALPDPGVPMLLLNRPQPDAPMPRASQPVSILALPPEEEAELAAVHALVRDRRRALIVEQSGDFGKRVAGRFAETFELGGGRVVGRTEYVPDEFDHTGRLSILLDLDRSEQRIARVADVLGRPVEAVPQRRTDVDLIFLATRGGDARQLMPQLKFLDLGDLPVFATSQAWPGGDVGSDLDGLEFPIAPWLLAEGDAAERRRRAERRFESIRANPTLSELHALGRDALALVPWLAMMKRDPALYLAGRVGRLRLADGVVLERDLPWARVENGRPVLYEPQS